MPNSNPTPLSSLKLPSKLTPRNSARALLFGVALSGLFVATTAVSACDPAPTRATFEAPATAHPSPKQPSRAPAVRSGLTRGSSISVDELLEFLRIATGQPIIRVATPRGQTGILPTPLSTGAPIAIVPSEAPLTVPVAKALLAANGIAVTPFLLEGEISILLVREDPKALAHLGTPEQTASASRPAEAPPQMAHVDDTWSIAPRSRGWIILDIDHASPTSLRKAIDRMVNERNLRVMEIGSHGQLLLDGPGEALTRAVELVRFLDKPEIWTEPAPRTPTGSRGATQRARSNRAATPTSEEGTSENSHTRQLRPRTRAAQAPAPAPARVPAPKTPDAPAPETETAPSAEKDPRVLTRR